MPEGHGIPVGGKWQVIAGERRSGDYSRVWEVRYSPDGSKLAVRAQIGETSVLVVDGVQGPPFGMVQDIAFSQDSARVAYRAADSITQANPKEYVVCGKKRSDPFDMVGPPSFDSTGTKITFGASTGRELWRHVMDAE